MASEVVVICMAVSTKTKCNGKRQERVSCIVKHICKQDCTHTHLMLDCYSQQFDVFGRSLSRRVDEDDVIRIACCMVYSGRLFERHGNMVE